MKAYHKELLVEATFAIEQGQEAVADALIKEVIAAESGEEVDEEEVVEEEPEEKEEKKEEKEEKEETEEEESQFLAILFNKDKQIINMDVFDEKTKKDAKEKATEKMSIGANDKLEIYPVGGITIEELEISL